MSAIDLQQLGAGFSHPAFGSQAIFRQVLQALAGPGSEHRLQHDAEWPGQGDEAAAVALLALLDADCRLWLSGGLRHGPVAAWLRFHTGCQLVDHPGESQFAWFARGDQWPALTECATGTDQYPDQSTTCLLEASLGLVEGSTTAAPGEAMAPSSWILSGPGLQQPRTVVIAGLPADFAAQWQANHDSFPRGVDLLITSGPRLMGLPRSTRVQPAPMGGR